MQVPSNFFSAGIIGLGSSIPERVLTNADLEKMVDTSDEWIIKRTGIRERRILEDTRPTYELGVEAAQKAIEDAGIKAEDIDLVIATTCTPDYLTPSTSSIIQGRINASKAAAFDLNAACSGFIYGLSTASQFIATGCYKYILIVACEALSKVVDWEDRKTCVLFGDAAGAVVVGPSEKGYGLLAAELGSDGAMGSVITIPNCFISESDKEKRLHENKRVIWMDGSEVFKFAVRIMAYASEKIVTSAGLSIEDIDLIFPHQANIRIIDGAVKRLGIEDCKVFTNVEKYGNTSSASIPLALDEAYREGKLKKGSNLVLVGFGGGLTWGAAIVRWTK